MKRPVAPKIMTSKVRKAVGHSLSIATLTSFPLGLTGLSLQAQADQARNLAIPHPTPERILLRSEKTFNLAGKDYSICFFLTVGKAYAKDNPEMAFEMAGSGYFCGTGTDHKDIYKDLKNDYTDGNIMFELDATEPENSGRKRYIGYSCTSSFADCDRSDLFELIYSTQEKSWTVNFAFERTADYEAPETEPDVRSYQETNLKLVEVKHEMPRLEL